MWSSLNGVVRVSRKSEQKKTFTWECQRRVEKRKRKIIRTAWPPLRCWSHLQIKDNPNPLPTVSSCKNLNLNAVISEGGEKRGTGKCLVTRRTNFTTVCLYVFTRSKLCSARASMESSKLAKRKSRVKRRLWWKQMKIQVIIWDSNRKIGKK